MGSRGTRTYSAPSRATQIDRSTTARPTPSQTTNSSLFPQPTPAGNPFWRGLAGGFLGAGLASMLFGHGMGYGGGMGGGGLGLIPMLLIGFGIYYFVRRMTAGRSASNYFAPSTTAIDTPDITQPLDITEADKAAFAQLLQHIQQAWSEGDLNRLRQYVTPEMLQYFSEELSSNASHGLANKIEQVTLISANTLESWQEFDLYYATAQLQWTALDYMVRLDRKPNDSDYIASGNAIHPETAEEIWTFTRAAGGNWLLSAIQQIA